MNKTKKLMRFSIFILFFLIIGYVGLYLFAWFSPKLVIDKANKLYFYDSEKKLFPGSVDKDWVSLNNISKHLINATISIEDKNFFKHHGFDYPRIIKSLYVNFINGEKLQGASTITQQYAKNLFLDFGKTWKRKADEAWLTLRLETHYSKEEILEGYLNTINYGGVFGIENASHYYFNKQAKNLTLAEATILAGIPKSPVYYSPIANEQNAKDRQQLILNSMVKNKYITEDDLNNALKEELVYLKFEDQNKLTTLMYYQDAVIDELKNIDAIPESFLKTGGLKIYTNLDIKAQTIIDDSIKKNMKDAKDLQIASVAMKPETGQVLALAGGVDYSKSQFNRAISSKRQVGSEEINIMEMMQAYGTFANEGYKIKPYFIEKIEDINGNTIYKYQTVKENVLNKSIVFILNEMLSNCYAGEFIDYSYPTCFSIGPRISKKYAIKTGSTDSDHMIMGFNKDLVVGVWTGYDDNRPSSGSNNVFSKHVWVDVMENYLENKEDSWYVIPKNIVGVLVDPISGNIANNNTKKKKIFYYIKGTEPYDNNPDLEDLVPTIKEQ